MIDRTSQTWATIVAWADEEERLALLQLRQVGLDQYDTESLRGRLRALDDLRALTADKHVETQIPLMA